MFSLCSYKQYLKHDGNQARSKVLTGDDVHCDSSFLETVVWPKREKKWTQVLLNSFSRAFNCISQFSSVDGVYSVVITWPKYGILVAHSLQPLMNNMRWSWKRKRLSFFFILSYRWSEASVKCKMVLMVIPIPGIEP